MTKTRLLLVALLSACGSSSTSSVDSFTARLKTAICDQSVRCHQFPDSATCLAAEDAAIDFKGLALDVSSGVIKFDPAAGDRVIADVASFKCDGTGLEEIRKYLTDAQAAVTGTLAQGAVCDNETECASGNCDITSCGPNECCQGTCGAAPVKAADGADCSDSHLCDGTDLCVYDPSSTTYTCKPPIAEGAACPGSDCAEGLLCVTDSSGAGTCRKPIALGDACTGELNECGQDAVCSSGTCVARLAVGAACDPSRFDQCVPWSMCSQATSTCTALALPGAACDDSAGDYCLAGSCSTDTSTCPTEARTCAVNPQ